MKIKLELDNHVTSTFEAENKREAYNKAIDICRNFDSGGVLMIDGKDYGEIDKIPDSLDTYHFIVYT